MEVPAELKQALVAGLALFAMGLFASAAWHKIHNFAEFKGFTAAYRLLPPPLVGAASRSVVFLEVAAVVALLFGIPGFELLAAGLLTLYAVAMAINLFRGRSDIDCGCGGAAMPLSTALVIRNLLLALTFGWAAGHWSGVGSLTAFGPGSIAAILGFAVGLGIFYASFNQLQANAALRRRLQVATG